jgi:hypothetical protein
MASKTLKARRFQEISGSQQADRRDSTRRMQFGVIAGRSRSKPSLRNHMPAKSATGNEYSCTIEKNQNGKYNVRIRAIFGRGPWALPVYFLASSFDGAMRKLEEALQVLQKNEERLRFWGVERTDDPSLAGELLEEFGLWLDRRTEFPRKAAQVALASERPVSAAALAPVRRVLAEAVAQERAAVASD